MAGAPYPRSLPLSEQALWLRLHWDFDSTIRKGRLISRGVVRPSPLSASYKVRIEYVLRTRPHVYVVDPPLEKRDGLRAEHLWGDDEPCLYLPNAGEWHSTKLLATTIVPWLLLWLSFYELWLITG